MKRLFAIMTRYDWGLAAGLIIVSLFWMGLRLPQSKGKSAQVFIDNRLIDTIDLSQDRTFTYQVQLGEITVQITGRQAQVIESNCPLKTCQKLGRISRQGEIIVCLPNKFMVVIVSGAASAVQGVTG